MVTGKVLFFNPDRQFGVIRDDTGKRYIAVESQIEPDCYGRRFLICGERITFEPVHDDRGAHAENVRIDRVCDYDIQYREVCRVTSWNGTFGFAARETGGFLFIHQNQIVTEGTLAPGVYIRVKPVPPQPLKKGWSWEGDEIEIFEEPEIETEPAESNEPLT
jgi:cold shock CspA family protein